MNYLTLIGTVALINVLGAISPGPDFIITVRNSLRYSKQSGIFTGLGVAVGLLVHVTYCATGVGLIISNSVVLFSIMKILGGCYLVWLGITSILSRESKITISDEKEHVDISNFKAFSNGFLNNVLNPKAMLFFLSLFTFVLNPMPPTWVILVCAFNIFLTAVIWFSSVATFLTNKHVRKTFLRFERPINIVLGCILGYLGIKVLLMLFQ
jgi:RhtB (resistance to homoserine/threonine) family protein